MTKQSPEDCAHHGPGDAEHVRDQPEVVAAGAPVKFHEVEIMLCPDRVRVRVRGRWQMARAHVVRRWNQGSRSQAGYATMMVPT